MDDDKNNRNREDTYYFISEIIKLILEINCNLVKLNNTKIFSDLLHVFFIDYDKLSGNIKNINNYNDFLTKLSLSMHGTYAMFDDCFICGSFIYNLLCEKQHCSQKNKDNINEITIFPSIKTDISIFDKYLSYISEDVNFTTYSGYDIVFKISNKKYKSAQEVLLYFVDKENGACFDGNNIIIHPLCFINMMKYELFDENITLDGYDNQRFQCTSKYIKPIMYNDITMFKEIITMQQIHSIPQDAIDSIYNVSLYLKRYDFIDYLLKNNVKPPINTVFDAIRDNQKEYIELLIKYKINIDVLNVDGFSPIEYALNIFRYDENIYNLVLLLNNYKYERNPKWWDYVNNIKIYNVTVKNEFDKAVLENIQENNGNISTIEQLNNCLVRNMIKSNMFRELRLFVRKNIKHIDVCTLLQQIIEFQNTKILFYVSQYIPISNELIQTYFDLQVYETLLEIADKDINVFNMTLILNHLIEKCDIKGIIFIFEYIDTSFAKFVFHDGSTLLHRLCTQNQYPEDDLMRLKQIQCFKVLLHYYPESYNIRNDDGDTPLFCACNNSYFTELLLSKEINLIDKNNIGDTYLHKIIRNGSFETLLRLFACGTKNIGNVINEKNKNNETPVLLACKLKKQECCNILINNGADITIPDENENTLYHYISLYGLSKINVDALPEIRNQFGFTPTDYLIQTICDNINGKQSN